MTIRRCVSRTDPVITKGRRKGQTMSVPCAKIATHGMVNSYDDGVTWYDHGGAWCLEHAERHAKTWAMAKVYDLTTPPTNVTPNAGH